MENNLIILLIVTAVFIAVLIAITLIIIKLGKIAFGNVKAGAPKSFGLFFIRSNFHRIIALILIVYAILVIAVFKLDSQDKLITVLSSIAAFTLGGFTGISEDSKSSDKDEDNKENKKQGKIERK